MIHSQTFILNLNKMQVFLFFFFYSFFFFFFYKYETLQVLSAYWEKCMAVTKLCKQKNLKLQHKWSY